MEPDRRPLSLESAQLLRRTASHSTPYMPRRHPLSAAQRPPMESFTKNIPLFYNVLAAMQTMDRIGSLRSRLGAVLKTTRRPGRDQLGGSDGRWHVFPCKKRGAEIGNTKRVKGTKIMLLIDGEGLPLGVDTESANATEMNLIERVIDRRTSQQQPQRLIYDKAADSDPLRKRLAERGVELVCQHCRSRNK